MSTVYKINKGINRSIEFKGIKAQYIGYLAVGLVALLILFALLHAIGINIYVCLGIVLPAGVALYVIVQTFSIKYGQNGLIKKTMQARLPDCIRCKSRRLFTQLNNTCEKN